MTELMSALLYVETMPAYLLNLSFLPLVSGSFYFFVVLFQYLFEGHSKFLHLDTVDKGGISCTNSFNYTVTPCGNGDFCS